MEHYPSYSMAPDFVGDSNFDPIGNSLPQHQEEYFDPLLVASVGSNSVTEIPGNWSHLRPSTLNESDGVVNNTDIFKILSGKMSSQMIVNPHKKNTEETYPNCSYYIQAPIISNLQPYLGFSEGSTNIPNRPIVQDVQRLTTTLDMQPSPTIIVPERPRLTDVLDHSLKEVEAAGTAIGGLGYNFTNDIKNIFHDLNARLQLYNQVLLKEEQNSEIERRMLEQELREKQAFLEEQTKILAAKESLVENLTKTLAQEQLKIDSLQHCGEQKLEEQLQNHKKFQEHAARQLYNRKLLHKAFTALKKVAQDCSRRHWEAACMQRAEEVCCRMKEKFRGSQEQMEREMEKLKSEKAVLESDRGEYETAVQQALMRGLCSLNLEALKVLRVTDSESDKIQSQPEKGDVLHEHNTDGQTVRQRTPALVIKESTDLTAANQDLATQKCSATEVFSGVSFGHHRHTSENTAEANCYMSKTVIKSSKSQRRTTVMGANRKNN